MRGAFRLFLVFGVLGLAGCGDNAPVGTSGGLPLRTVDAVSAPASCGDGETLVSAYCFADPGRSISARGPAIQADAEGKLTVSS